MAAALTATAAVLPFAASASAATTTDYTHATFLQHALGLPASDTNPALESVTYDRFQWLLQQPGNFAVLIGDPATDASFAARAQDVELAAKAKDAKKVYWFNPNLSGNAKVGTITEPNLDIRNPAAINLPPASQTKYGNAWLNLIGQYLGNGYTATVNSPLGEGATVTATKSAGAANDAGNAQVGGAAGALYDYTGASAPASAQHSFFFIYNKAVATAKIISWVDLTNETVSQTAQEKVKTALSAGGTLAQSDQFAFWKKWGGDRQAGQGSATPTPPTAGGSIRSPTPRSSTCSRPERTPRTR
jgi:hypothetical protein